MAFPGAGLADQEGEGEQVQRTIGDDEHPYALGDRLLCWLDQSLVETLSSL